MEAQNSIAKVAVVILNWNGQQLLEQFLPSVVQSQYPNLELIVADNASSDNSIAFLQSQYPSIRIIQLDQNYGFAGGYNLALKQVEADYYVLLNSDVETTLNWTQPIIDLMESDLSIAACQPKIKSYHQKTHFEYAGAAGGWIDALGYTFSRGRVFDTVEEDQGQYDDVQEIFWASGCAMFVRADLYHQFGGLDADFFAHMEEIDLCWRMKNAGYKIMVCPQSTVYHVGGSTLQADSPRKTQLNFRNNLIMLLKNLPWSSLLWVLPIRFLLDGVAGVRFLTQAKFSHCWAIVKAHWLFILLLPKWLGNRRKAKQAIQKNRIGKASAVGVYKGSIVFKHFISGWKRFENFVK